MKFVIWTWAFDERIGGNIALHLLCRRLNEAGETALIWPAERPRPAVRRSLRQVLQTVRWHARYAVKAWRPANPFLNPVAKLQDLDGSVVIYPEIVDGNPLGQPRVVRWLLHRPGHHTGRAAYGANDLFFHYQEAFGEGTRSENKLAITWLNEAYEHRNFGARSGSCFLMRKGKGRPIVHDLEESVRIDNLLHDEKAEIFNRTKYFFSYDLYTLYNLYALICGCIPVVIPDPAVSKEEWLADEADRYGIAYGLDDLPWAIATRSKMLRRLEGLRTREDEMLHQFINTCRTAFSGSASD